MAWRTLRHTSASRLLMAGVDLKTVQERMGDKTLAITARYARFAPTHKSQALENLVGSVPVQSGCKLAANTQKGRAEQKIE